MPSPEPYYQKQLASFEKGDKFRFLKKDLFFSIRALLILKGLKFVVLIPIINIFIEKKITTEQIIYLSAVFLLLFFLPKFLKKEKAIFLGLKSKYKTIVVAEIIDKNSKIGKGEVYEIRIQNQKLAVPRNLYEECKIGDKIEIHYPSQTEIVSYFLIKRYVPE